jgi:DSF synthase
MKPSSASVSSQTIDFVPPAAANNISLRGRWTGASDFDVSGHFERLRLKEIAVEFDPHLRALWCKLLYRERPNFTLAILNEIGLVQQAVVEAFAGDRRPPLDYVIWHSAMPGVFGLGGDLAHFAELIRRGDEAGLMHYAQSCVDRVHRNWTAMEAPVTTVSLIQGSCLGGAFECALSSNLMVVERTAKIGLPEVLFNLFPGMGAYSFLSRRVAPYLARQIISGGRLYLGQELYEMGIADVLADDGCGEQALIEHIRDSQPKHGLRRYLDKIGRMAHPLEKEELLAVTRLWVERALELTDADLKIMARLVSAQARQHKRTAA